MQLHDGDGYNRKQFNQEKKQGEANNRTMSRLAARRSRSRAVREMGCRLHKTCLKPTPAPVPGWDQLEAEGSTFPAMDEQRAAVDLAFDLVLSAAAELVE
jgi:hypothetical protein